MRTALLECARGGDFVYHGYAGHLLLSGIAHVLRVRVIAAERCFVWSALTGDARTRSANVRVAADGADVFVTGSADNARAVEAITEVAGAVPGVAHVDNQVGVGGHWRW